MGAQVVWKVEQEKVVRLLKSEKLRFLIVGAGNTVIGYACFLLTFALMDPWAGPVAILVAAYLVALPIAFVNQRVFVFRSRAPWVREFGRFLLANSTIFAINVVALPICIRLSEGDPRIVQGVFVMVSTVASYFAHKYFSFSR
ncbi:hypothetical protein GUV62_14180 [Stenotrophomonas maltophilia]|uniref:GtrA family protein n=1 Tax=Stenotrophomonas maltophilia group TaxID=995085 RepID=UPI001F19E058|nr:MULTISPECIES: GtrA family protein [Stenotrophomonas maltophilia group]MCF3493375.1 hypothetical protein [Stenotrophomonas maltophilia]MCF3513683.1 hypothetical protein [Stenotrophomonas maltophilia]